MLNKIGQIFLTSLAAIAAFFMLASKVKRDERKKIKLEQKAAAYGADKRAKKEAREIDDEIDSFDDQRLADELRKYTRDRSD